MDAKLELEIAGSKLLGCSPYLYYTDRLSIDNN
jgi:hypothetical protein